MARRKGFFAQLAKLLSGKPAAKRKPVQARKLARKAMAPFVPAQIPDQMPDDWPLLFESTDPEELAKGRFPELAQYQELAREIWEVEASQYRNWQKSAVRDGLFDGSTAKVEWSTGLDDARCSVCRRMEGKTVPLGQPFKLPNGRSILFPPACGFSPSSGGGCRCGVDLILPD